MADILIRDVDADVHESLKQKAAQAGQTLGAYLRDLLTAEAAEPAFARWYANVRARRTVGPGPVDAAALVRLGRDEREQVLAERLDT